MHSNSENPFRKCVDLLLPIGRLRAWSLIVTVFGDLAQDPGDSISSPMISKILEPIGIKSDAMRVALHRLRKEGWLTSSKIGRTSHHKLSKFGREQCAMASPRIYSPKPEFDKCWHVLIGQPQQQSEPIANDYPFPDVEHITVSPGIYIGNGSLPRKPSGYIVIEGMQPDIPEWLKVRIGTTELCNSYRKLLIAAKSVGAYNSDFAQFTPLEVATVRTLLVHNWRRLVLKHPLLPNGFYPNGWTGSECRKAIITLLENLERPSLISLTECCRHKSKS